VDEIPGRTLQTAALLRQAVADAKPQPEVQEIEREVAGLESGFRSLLELSRKSIRSGSSRGLASQMKAAWDLGRSRLATWQDVLRRRSAKLQSHLAEVRAQDDWWRRIENSVDAEQIPPEMRAEMAALRRSLEEARLAVLTRRNQVLTVQARVADWQMDLEHLNEEIQGGLQAERGRLLSLDAKPIWAGNEPGAESSVNRADVGKLAAPHAKASGTAAGQQRIVTYFLRGVASALLWQIGIFAVIALGAAAARRRWHSRIAEAGRQGGVLLAALSRPNSLSILATGLLVSFWPTGLGDVLVALGWLAMLIPLLRLIPALLPQDTMRFSWILFGWMVAQTLLGLLPAATLSARLSSIVLAGTIAWGMIWLHRRVQLRQPSVSRGLLLSGLKTGIALLGVSAAAQVVGMRALGGFLMSALLGTAFAATVLKAILALLLATLDVATGCRGHRADPRQVRLVRRGLHFLLGALFIALLLKSFEFDEVLLGAVAAVLKWKITVGAIQFTPGTVVTFGLVVMGAYAVSHLLRYFLALRLYDRMAVARGTAAAISKLFHYAMLTAGVLVGLASAGLELNKFAVIAGGLSVGAGFGMQTIISNFVSGLILLFERPVHVGDQVTVGSTSGEVTDIGIRASTIRTWDGADVVIPNASMVTGDFTNWTLSDDRRRAEVRIGAAYGSNPEHVIRLLKEAASTHSKVLAQPEPSALFIGFGESSLEFVLRYWTLLADHLQVNSDVHREIYRRFSEEAIEIPFPQREVHVHGLPAGIHTDDSQDT
jgi:small-conductance mechanosensitive channel